MVCEPAPGGETLDELLARARRALELLRMQEKDVAVVAHAVLNAAIRHLLEGGDPAAYRQTYTEIVSYEL